MRIIFLLLVLLTSSLFGLSQTENLNQVFEEIVIQTNRSQHALRDASKNIEIITKMEIAQSTATNTFELLQNLSSLDVRERGPNGVQADLSLRGSTFEQVLLLINGIRMADPQTGHHSAYIPVDIDDIERIEIIKGSAARIYGQNAFAGAINIVTSKSKKNNIKIGTQYGEHNLWGLRANLNIQQGNLSHRISASRSASDGYQYNTDYNIDNLYYEGNLDKGLTKYNLLAAFSNRRFGANGFYASPDFMDQFEKVQTSIMSFGATRSLKNGFIKSRVYWRRNQDDYEFIRNKPEIFRNLHLSQVYGIDLNSNIETGLGQTGIGLDVYQTQLFSNNLGARKRTSIQFFAEHEFKLMADKLIFVPGISASHYSDFGSKAFPGIELAYFINENLSILGNAGGTFRIPSFTDLYYDGPQNIGNENLDPEKAFSYDIGIKYVKQSISAQASYFSRASKNLIDWAKESEAQEQWQPLNFNSVNFNGFDFSLKWRNPNVMHNLKLNAIGISGTILNSSINQNETFLSNYALQNAKLSFVLNAEIQWFKGFSQSIRARILDRELLDDYKVLDMAFFYQKNAFQFNFKVSNVFSEVYRATNLVTMPERWIKIGLDYIINL